MLHAGLDLSRRRLDVCFCNPGAGEVAFTISRETLVGGEFGEGMILDTTCAPLVCRQAERFARRSVSPPTSQTCTAS
jgi:hypothetical protein